MTIGRGGQQPFIIPGTCGAVSHEHTRFWVDDNGNWWIEDIKGPNGNGTYVMGSDGEFRRITRKMIDRDTIVRLGPGSHTSFTFYANRLIAPDDFSYEFDLMEDKLREFKKEQAMLEAENEKKLKRVKMVRISGGILTGAFVILGVVCGKIGLASPAMLTGAIAAMMPSPDTKAMKNLAERKKAVLVCPKCFNPISENTVYNRMCPSCKAKG